MSERPEDVRRQCAPPPGSITKRKYRDAWALEVRVKGLPPFRKNFAFSKYNNSPVEAYAAAEAARFEYAYEHGLLKNQWRYTHGRTSEERWLEVDLTQGQKMQCEEAALPDVQERKWCARRDGNTWYAMSHDYKDGKDTTVMFHRLVMKCELKDLPGYVVDHIDRNGLNNRIDNLRVVTIAENARNHAMYATNTSGVCGVGYYKDGVRADWRENGKQRTERFSYDEFGKRAYELAIAFRTEKEKELNITVHYPEPSPQLKRPAPARSHDDETAERPAKKQRFIQDFMKPL